MDVTYGFLSLCVALSALTQGFSGFGFGILIMAAMSLIGADLERVSVFVTLSVIILVTTLLIRSKRQMRVHWKTAACITAGLVFTTPIGYRFVLQYGDMPVFRLALGFVLVFFALYRACKPHIKRHIPLFLAPVFGMFSGLLSGAFSSGGPPVVLYLYSQQDDPRMAVGTTQAVFLGSSLYRLIIVLSGDRGLSLALLSQTLWMAPIVISMTLLGFRLTQRLPVKPFLLVVYGIILLAGVINVAKGFEGLLAA